MSDTKMENVQCCEVCNVEMPASEFQKRPSCKKCLYESRKERYNATRRSKYMADEAYRAKFSQKYFDIIKKKRGEKREERLRLKQEHQVSIGLENKECRCCNTVKPKTRFRNHRYMCKDCDNAKPNDKLWRSIRARIKQALRTKNYIKNITTLEYLGCSTADYVQYLMSIDPKFTMENRGKEWHIDHVIPLSKFDLSSEDERRIAFNWRNTMPLTIYENLTKGNKISQPQLVRHIQKLNEYHQEHRLEFPEIFKNINAKYLVAGTP